MYEGDNVFEQLSGRGIYLRRLWPGNFFSTPMLLSRLRALTHGYNFCKQAFTVCNSIILQ